MGQSTAQLSVFLVGACGLFVQPLLHVGSHFTCEVFLLNTDISSCFQQPAGFWDRAWQVNTQIWHDCLQWEVKPSFAKISTVPSLLLLGGNPVGGSSAPCLEDLQLQMQTSEADLEPSQHAGHLVLALPSSAITLHYRGITFQSKSGRQVHLTCDLNLGHHPRSWY